MQSTYKCDECGACCHTLIIEISEADLIREPRLIQVTTPFKLAPGEGLFDDDGEPYIEQVPGFGAGGNLACGSAKPCPMLGADNRCGIYPTRPTTCVAFQAGSEQCQMARGMAGIEPLRPIGEAA